MRITGGKYRGRKLLVPPTGLRPTTDRTREALFNTLGNIHGLSFLDLYCGTGAVGLDAISRGAKPVVFVDKNVIACQTVEKNLDLIGESFEVINLRVTKFIRNNVGLGFDMVYLDPPYFSEEEKEELQKLKIASLIKPGGLLVTELAKKESFPEIADFSLIKEKIYGKTKLLYYKRALES